MTTAIASVEVEREPDGSLVVRWVLDGPLVPIDVAVGSGPDGADHHHETTVRAAESSARLCDVGEGRRFVSVRPHGGGPAVVAAERRLPFAEVSNFRDLGGYRSRSGGRVRWGAVYRAGALDGLGPDDLTLFAQLGVRAVFDLRTDLEREERPSVVTSRRITMLGRPRVPTTKEPSEMPRTVADGERRLFEVYCGLLDHAAEGIGELFTSLASDDGLPAVLHCTAGKDRTGIAAALLLDLLGVERSVVLDDYDLTARYLDAGRQRSTYERLIASGYSEAAAAAVLGTSRSAMEGALRYLDEEYGGVEAYLTGPAGLGDEHIRGLRRQLIDQA